jgi:cysteine desulfurase
MVTHHLYIRFQGKLKKAIDKARNRIAKAINADPAEIYFTGGGSEADNWAIKGIALANKNKGNHIITTKIEHHAVLHTCEYLEKQGFEVTYLDVDEEGSIRLEELKNAIKPSTILVTIMTANNEIGTVQPIKEIGAICKERKVFFHTDAVQAIGHIDMDVKNMDIDALSLSGHKIYGPKGVGVLYLRKGIKIHNLVHGGAQERNRRAGTENVAGIVGLGKAIELAMENLTEEKERLTYLRDKLIKGLLEIPYSKLNGSVGDRRLPGNVNISFEFIEGESVLLKEYVHQVEVLVHLDL